MKKMNAMHKAIMKCAAGGQISDESGEDPAEEASESPAQEAAEEGQEGILQNQITKPGKHKKKKKKKKKGLAPPSNKGESWEDGYR